MIQRRQYLGFSGEAGQAFLVGSKGFRKPLESHITVELGIGGSIDDTHAAFADLLRDLVVGDALADQRDLQNQAKLV